MFSRLNWEIFKESWPYFRRNPVLHTMMWLNNIKNRPALHAKLNEIVSAPSICRKLDETDAELRKRILSVKT